MRAKVWPSGVDSPATEVWGAGSRLRVVWIDEFVGPGGAGAEQEFLHLLGEKLPRLELDRRQPVFVHQHRLVTKPLLPGVPGDVVVNALSERTWIGAAIETLGFALQVTAIHHSRHACSFALTAFCAQARGSRATTMPSSSA